MASARAQPDLAELSSDMFLFILEVQCGTARLPREEGSLRRRIVGALEELAVKARNAGFGAQEIDDARYALAAAVDEVLQFSSWPLRQAWSVNPLQVELFQDRDAGVGFFTRLNALQRRSTGAGVREVYYLCLALGFRGRYHTTSPEELGRITEALALEIAQDMGPELSREGPPAPAPAPPGRELSATTVALGLLGVAIAVYAILLLVLVNAQGLVLAAIDRGG